jgi:hypothetical protein
MITTDGEDKMSDGFSTNDAVLWGAMNNMGNRNVGGGAWGDGAVGFGGRGVYASPENIRADILSNRDIGNTGIENLQREFANITSRDQVSDGFNRICDKMDSNATRQSDQMFALTRDVDNKFGIVTTQNHGIALAMKDQEIRNVERYCELKAGQATIEAKVDANQKFNELFAENQSLKTQVACGCTTGCTRRCHDHHGRG